MTFNPTKFQSISNLTAWLVKVSIATIILSMAYMVLMPFFPYSTEPNSSWENILGAIGSITIIITILIIVITLMWYYWATINIHSFGAKGVTSPRMAVIWWFVPIANLWKPYKIAQQIWRASNPEMKLSNGSEWKNTSNSNTIKLWWILALVSIFGSLIVGFFIGLTLGLMYDEAEAEHISESVSKSSIAGILTIPFHLLAIISIVYFIRMIRRISTRQEVKSGTSI